ncbi:MAG: CapA family protein [Verrucomicrobiota bacterium]
MAFVAQARPPAELPIFLEDSHAGSFYWIAENIPLDRPHTLVLFDAHSDASQVFESDTIREELRKPTNMDQLRLLTSEWRKAGTIQCFNWIEPLMPAPLAEVVWVVPGELTEERRQQLRDEIEAELNAHELVAPRAGEPLTPKFTVIGFDELAERAFELPTIASLDLDYFAESDGEDFGQVWNAILDLPDLQAITAAISTPYLKSMDQADALVSRFLEEAGLIANSRIEYDPNADCGPDNSRKARELRAAGKEIPTFQPKPKPKPPEIMVRGVSADFDGCHRVNMDDGFTIRLAEDAEQVEWRVLDFEHDVYNLMGDETPFAAGAPAILRLKSRPLVSDRIWIDERDLKPVLEFGTIRVQAIVAGDPSNVVTLRISKSEGFRAAIEESFNLPYVFGGSLMKGGPNRAFGGDCANLAVYAIRRSKHRQLPCSTPLQFEKHCDQIHEIAADEAFVSFGTHLAVLWEDTEPIGEFNDSDVFAHHLEGRPELISLGELKVDRREPKFLQLKQPEPAVTLIFGGDVMLARGIGNRIFTDPEFDPFVHVGDKLRSADLAIVNLECALTEPRPAPNQEFVFQARPNNVRVLKKAGIDIVSLSNNHTKDGGPAGFEQTKATLDDAGIGWIHNSWVIGNSFGWKTRIALVGVQPGDDLKTVRQVAALESTYVVVFPHWGIEHTDQISKEQREFAEELVEAGAGLVVGSGPHAPQGTDRIMGAPIFYSMGNLVFDTKGTNSNWKRGYLVEAKFDDQGWLISAEQLPYQIPEDW